MSILFGIFFDSIIRYKKNAEKRLSDRFLNHNPIS